AGPLEREQIIPGCVQSRLRPVLYKSMHKPLVRPDLNRFDRSRSLSECRILSKWLDESARRGCNVRNLSEPIPFKMGLQVSRCFRAQATAESHVRPNASSTGYNLPRTGSAKGVPDH